MGYSFDYLVGPLRCPRCGTVSPADESLDMITRLRDEPELAFLGVGDALPVDTARALNSDYRQLREPEPAEPTVLLHTWTCPACRQSFNWAEVVIRDGVIDAIRETTLDQAALRRAHFIVDDAKDVAARLAGVRSSLDLDDNSVVSILREKLPAPGG